MTMKPIEFASRISAQSFRVLPTNLISRAWGHVTRTSASRHLIKPFAQAFRIATAEAELNLTAYPNLNAFFTRKLKSGLRPIAPDSGAMVSPVDGTVSAFGRCEQQHLLQVKGKDFTLFGLLRNGPMARVFDDGFFATLYLSPQDYHRVHAPCDMRITGLGYMPGVLMPVNKPSVRWIDRLYTQNERVIIYADTPAGRTAVVLVGAHCVGSISLSFNDFVTNRPGVGPTHMNFERPLDVKKGDELGMFEMGSTVVVLFERDRIEWQLPQAGKPIRLGQRIAEIQTNLDAGQESVKE